MNKEIETYVAGYDLHYPIVNWPAYNAMLNFIAANDVAGFIFGGDQFDNQCISHHTRGKPIFRERGAYDRETLGFDKKILGSLDKVLKPKAKKIWVVGNHDRFEQDLIEEQPELEGTIERPKLLNLEARGWQIIPLGHAYRLGKLNVIHGEILSGIGNQAGMYPSRKAVELYADNVLAGHTHAPQSFTRVSPVEAKRRWMGWIAPILSNTNPQYLRNRPTAWVNGFVIIEVYASGQFNLYPVILFNGQFAYGGKIYRA